MRRKIFHMILMILAVSGAAFTRAFPGLQAARAGNLPVKNGVIAFTSRDQSGEIQIFTCKPDGSGVKQLTFKGNNLHPAWSRDGKKFAFMSDRNASGLQRFLPPPFHKFEIWVMDWNGSNQRMLADGGGPDWSPDNRKIAFDRGAQVWVMNADGSNQHQITHSNTAKVGPSWSTDGKQMVFILLGNPRSQIDPKPQIGIVNSDGSGERVLTDKDRTNFRVNPDGTRTVLETAHDANAPDWSPAGNKIAFWSGIERQYGQVWIISPDGTGCRQLTSEPAPISSDNPSWSPDGKKILFDTNRSRRGAEIWVMNSDGSDQHKITDGFGRSSWQPVVQK